MREVSKTSHQSHKCWTGRKGFVFRQSNESPPCAKEVMAYCRAEHFVDKSVIGGRVQRLS